MKNIRIILISTLLVITASAHSGVTAGNIMFLLRYLAQKDAPYNKKTKDFDPSFCIAAETAAQNLVKALAPHLVKDQSAKKWRIKSAIDPTCWLFGASTSEHQCSHQCTADICAYTRWAEQEGLPLSHESTTMDLWNNYKAYIDYAKNELHLNSLRLSVEWCLVQPQPNTINHEALEHYAEQFTYMIQQGMTPVICLHHYTDPCWFLDQGGFEKKANLRLFAQFCGTVYEALIIKLDEKIRNGSISQAALNIMQQRPPLFATFNSPEGYAFKGYKEGTLPPANPEKSSLRWATKILGNMMQAHVLAYENMNHMFTTSNQNPLIKKPRIGFLKNIHQIDPAPTKLGLGIKLPKAMAKLGCSVAQLVQSECIYQFFTKGVFRVGPFGPKTKNKKAPQSLDFIGLNYYSNRHMDMKTKKIDEPEAIQTDNDHYCVYPEGLYRAIVELSTKLARPLHIPIYVTENGIATSDEAKRNSFYMSYLSELIRAVNNGYDVRGYLTWTLADNYEWPKAKTTATTVRRRYGLCIASEDGKTLAKKDGAQFYSSLAHTFSQAIQQA